MNTGASFTLFIAIYLLVALTTGWYYLLRPVSTVMKVMLHNEKVEIHQRLKIALFMIASYSVPLSWWIWLFVHFYT